MSLETACKQLECIAAICTAEIILANDLANGSDEDSEIAIAKSVAAGLAQVALMIQPLQLEAFRLEGETASTAPSFRLQLTP
jgi:hypothetical protein